jgi:hypothetical protein
VTNETIAEDDPIFRVRARHPLCGDLRFVKVRQDRRDYCSLRRDNAGSGSLTTITAARQTVEYWRGKGWIVAE